MRTQILAAVLLVTTSNGPIMKADGQSSIVNSPMPGTLGSFRDRYRPLLVFAPTEKDDRFLMQARFVADGGLSLPERQVLFVPLVLRREQTSHGPVLSHAQIAEFSKNEAEAVRRRFRVRPEEFTVILIGKDGGEKFRSHAPVTIERLNAVIDAMPMRQQEVRNGNTK